jgi:hypothetical protein
MLLGNLPLSNQNKKSKIKLLLTYLFVGKILKFPISLLVMDRLFYICISALIMAIFIAELLLSRILFVHIKYYC